MTRVLLEADIIPSVVRLHEVEAFGLEPFLVLEVTIKIDCRCTRTSVPSRNHIKPFIRWCFPGVDNISKKSSLGADHLTFEGDGGWGWKI